MSAIITRSAFFYLLISITLLGTGISNAQSNGKKPVYVLVHGAWHGGWAWQKVSAGLRGQGEIVYTPTLSGLGEHKNTLNYDINLETHISDLVNLIEMEDLHDVILVGHSYSGAVIAGVADRIPERLSKLVFFDAMIVDNGQSAFTVQPKEIQNAIAGIAAKSKGLSVPAWSADAFGVTNPDDIKWVNSRLTAHPYKTFTQKLMLKHPFGNGLPLIYIACTNPMLPIVKEIVSKIQNNGHWKYYTLDTGHDAMITKPDEVTALLESLKN